MLTLSNADGIKTVPSQQPDILVISRVFPPDAGGIQEYAYNRCLQDPDRIMVLSSACADDESFDRVQPFPIYRWSMPALSRFGALGSILKQILNMFWSVVLGVQLYQRHGYRYIEWCHGYDFPALLVLSYLLPVECFIYLHGDDVLCPQKNPIFRWLFEWTLQRTKVIVCNSTFTGDYLKENFRVDSPTQTINPTVRPEKFGNVNLEELNTLGSQIRSKYQIPEKAIVILSVGRLVRRKGFDRVIEYLPSLLAEGIDIYYIICGKGGMEPELRELAANLDVVSRVIFAGYVPDEELASYYAACDLFSMLTFFDSKDKSIEGFGIVYLEAGYFGKPVIASRSGGVQDAVIHQENGLLVDPNSTDETLNSLRQLCANEELGKQLGRKGKELANRVTPHRCLYVN
ncbi:MAG: glycosyltransferase family 4 protein [Rivularia sp. ALOHA_DT_140]|nr:glycosyltransferase family 4 protein [Rivularia sp. ALOHA_DT_140]